MRINIITNCSSTRLIAPLARVQDLPNNLSNAEAIDHWVKMLNSHEKTTTPREQYRGQGFLTLLKTLSDFTAESVHIITGGLGFTAIDESIVPYDFSASPKEEHNITQKVTKEPFSLNVWWSLINKARNIDSGGSPVSSFIQSMDADEVCIIACSKLFLKYIAQDFLSAPEEAKRKCKILLTASSIGSVPVQLRPYIITFERASINHIPGNRNDVQHRALYQFMQKVQDLGTFYQPAHALTSFVFGTTAGGQSEQLDIPQVLEDRPELLQFEPEVAYKILYREVGPFGGRQNFIGHFLKAKMEAGLIQKPTASADDDALDALESFMPQTSSSPSSEDEAGINLLTIFADALRKTHPNAEFAAADICAWAERYTQKKEINLPDVFTQPIKLVYFLKSYASLIGFVQFEKSYKLEVK